MLDCMLFYVLVRVGFPHRFRVRPQQKLHQSTSIRTINPKSVMAIPTSVVALTVGAFHWKISGADARQRLACLESGISLRPFQVAFGLGNANLYF